MHAVRRNIDERLRELQRAALGGHPQDQEDYFRAAVRAGDCALIGEALFAMGPELASRVLGTQPGGERDENAICLGLHLVQLGYLPDIPVKSYNPYTSFTELVVKTEPRWINLPESVRGRARRRRFQAKISFSYLNSFGNEEGVDSQSPTFYFSLDPLGKHYEAEQYIHGLGWDEAARRIAPSVRFLARWTGSNAFTRPWAGGVRQDVAGGPSYWVENNTFAWRESDPGRVGEGTGSSPDDRWQHFLQGSRAGYVPGEEIPPRPPDPYWNEEQVAVWLRDPERNDAIRALFYADLWLAELLVPGEDVGYDPITGGPAVQSNPPWRLNADPRLRMAQRRAATERSVEALAALYRERMRVGDLHPANLWLAARIPPYNTCLAEVHDAAELAFGEEIPRPRPSRSYYDIAIYDLILDLFYSDLLQEKRQGEAIPRERMIMRLRAMRWLLIQAYDVTAKSVGPDRQWLAPRPFKESSRIKQALLSPTLSVSRIYFAAINEAAHATARLLSRIIPPDVRADTVLALWGKLQRHLLRSPQ